jgi:mannose-1-phosphate guanylyltransferase
VVVLARDSGLYQENSTPKPFIKLDDGESLLQKAFLRGTNLNNVGNVLIVTNRELIFKVEDDIVSLQDVYGRVPDNKDLLAK